MEYNTMMKKMYLCECVFNDVFSRFYHQLSNQDAVVLKDFFKDPAIASAEMIDAILETIFQRIELSDDEQQTVMNKTYDEWKKTDDCETLSKSSDSFHDVKKEVMNKKLGDYTPIFYNDHYVNPSILQTF